MTEGRVVVKRGWFWVSLHYIVLAVTFGTNRRFLTDYLTTIGPWIGVPEGYDPSRPENQPTLEHEREHIRQYHRYGLGWLPLGMLVVAILYAIVPLPLGFAYFRWRLEREAYAVGYRAELKLYAARPGVLPPDVWARRRQLIEHGVAQLSGGSYGWAWLPSSQVRRWFEAHV